MTPRQQKTLEQHVEARNRLVLIRAEWDRLSRVKRESDAYAIQLSEAIDNKLVDLYRSEATAKDIYDATKTNLIANGLDYEATIRKFPEPKLKKVIPKVVTDQTKELDRLRAEILDLKANVRAKDAEIVQLKGVPIPTCGT